MIGGRQKYLALLKGCEDILSRQDWIIKILDSTDGSGNIKIKKKTDFVFCPVMKIVYADRNI